MKIDQNWSVLVSSACGGNWARSYVTSPKEPVSVAQYVSNVKKLEKKAISCTALHFEREHPEVSDLETDLEAVEACQFEPEVYRAMSDHNGQRLRQKTMTGGEERLHGSI